MSRKPRTHCKNCNIELDITNSVYSKFSRLGSCKECYNKYKRQVNIKCQNNKHIDDVKEYHKYNHLLRTYGLTKEQFQFKLKLQLNGCAICKLEFNEERKVCMDHDHKTNINRDLLCYSCNTILGLVNDNELLLFNIIEYLKRHNIKKVI